jgi:hypothetical protein
MALCFTSCATVLLTVNTKVQATGKTLATIRILLEHGADVNATNAEGRTPLSSCALWNFAVRCWFLLEYREYCDSLWFCCLPIFAETGWC